MRALSSRQGRIQSYFIGLLSLYLLSCTSVSVNEVLLICVFAVYEYVADSEEASLSQCESVRSLCSVDEAEYQAKTQQFFEGMARLRQEVEAEQKIEQQKKTHTVSRSFYPRRVSDNVTHRTNVMLNISSPPEPKPPQPTGAQLYETFSNKLLFPDFMPSVSLDRRRSASAASDTRISLELGELLRPGLTERSLSVTSTPSTLQRPSSRQSESEESISMVDVTWTHRKPAARKRLRPQPRMWEETEAETLSVVQTSKKQEKKKEIGKQQETIQLREMERLRERRRRDEIVKQLEFVEQQEQKIKDQLAKQQKMLQQLTAERQQEIERERVQDFVRQQELLKEQEVIRKQELMRLSELQQQHELAKKLAFQQRQTEVEQKELVEKKVESQKETSFVTIDVSAPVKPVKSEMEISVESTVISVESVKASTPEDISAPVKPVKSEMEISMESTVISVESVKASTPEDVSEAKLHKLEMVGEEHAALPPFDTAKSLEAPVLSAIETTSVPVMEDDAAISVAKEITHTEQVSEILTPQDLQVVELVEKSFDAEPTKASKTLAAAHSVSSEDDVFYDASDVDVQSLNNDVAEAGETIPAGSLLMAPVFELPLADVTAFDGAGAILECRVTGNPTPEVMWFVNGVEIRSMPPEVTVSYHAGVCRLVIVDVMPDDEGEYTIQAINEAGSCLTSAYLTVLRKSVTFVSAGIM